MEKYQEEFKIWLKILEVSKKSEINIYEKWKFDFMAFYKDMGGQKPKGSVLVRQSQSCGFNPENCIWAFPFDSINEGLKKHRKIRTDSITGVTGVTWNNSKFRWWARIRVDGKQKHLTFSKDKNEAIKARLEAELKHYGSIQQKEFAYLLV